MVDDIRILYGCSYGHGPVFNLRLQIKTGSGIVDLVTRVLIERLAFRDLSVRLPERILTPPLVEGVGRAGIEFIPSLPKIMLVC